MSKLVLSGLSAALLTAACSQVSSIPARSVATITGAPFVSSAQPGAPAGRGSIYGERPIYGAAAPVTQPARQYTPAPPYSATEQVAAYAAQPQLSSAVTVPTPYYTAMTEDLPAPAQPAALPSYEVAAYTPPPASPLARPSIVAPYVAPARMPASEPPASRPAATPDYLDGSVAEATDFREGAGRWSVGPSTGETPQLAAAASTAAPLPFPRRKPGADARASTVSDQLRIPTRPSSRTHYTQGYTPPAIEYQIPHLPQEEPLWCWAAAAQQAIGWVNRGRAPAQCAIVALAHNIPIDECCADRGGICAKTGEIPAIGALVAKFGGYAAELGAVPRDPQQVYDILKEGGTLLIRLRPQPHEDAVGIRHMIVVRGIEWLRLPNDELQATLLYNDPLGEGQRAVSFDEIVDFFEQALLIKRKS